MPNSRWPEPEGVKPENLFGDENKTVKGRVDVISTPPSILERSWDGLFNLKHKKMIAV
jgi:hypothetical protein